MKQWFEFLILSYFVSATGFCVGQNYNDISKYQNSPYRDKIEPLREPFDLSKYPTWRNKENYVNPLPIQNNNIKGEAIFSKVHQKN